MVSIPPLMAWFRVPKVVFASEGLSLVGLAGADLVFGVPGWIVYFVMAEKGLIDPSNVE